MHIDRVKGSIYKNSTAKTSELIKKILAAVYETDASINELRDACSFAQSVLVNSVSGEPAGKLSAEVKTALEEFEKGFCSQFDA